MAGNEYLRAHVELSFQLLYLYNIRDRDFVHRTCGFLSVRHARQIFEQSAREDPVEQDEAENQHAEPQP